MITAYLCEERPVIGRRDRPTNEKAYALLERYKILAKVEISHDWEALRLENTHTIFIRTKDTYKQRRIYKLISCTDVKAIKETE